MIGFSKRHVLFKPAGSGDPVRNNELSNSSSQGFCLDSFLYTIIRRFRQLTEIKYILNWEIANCFILDHGSTRPAATKMA